MSLIAQGHLKPISPIKTFSFADIPSAFRYMRGANHIGKIVMSDGINAEVKALVSFLNNGYAVLFANTWYAGPT